MIGYTIHSSLPFEKDLARLSKKFPNIRNDIHQAFDKVQSGSNFGSGIPGGKGKLYKLRVGSSDLKRGKSGGFRVIFYLKAPSSLYPLICYFKGERGDVPIKDLEERAKELGLNI